MFANFGTSKNWKDRLEELHKARLEFGKHYEIMTPYERLLIGKEIREEREAIEKDVLAGAFVEYRQAIERVNAAVSVVERARTKERARWDAGKLNAEMDVVRSLVKTAITSPSGVSNEPDIKKLEKIYADFSGSGDLHKQRAAAEVFQELVSLIGGDNFDVRLKANGLASQARSDAEKSRGMPEIDEAVKNVEKEGDAFNAARAMLLHVDDALGDTRPNGTVGNYSIAKELATTKINADGTITKYEHTNDMPEG